jgi:mannose-6-phosphate isomerase-like protein (cupin superfamily)
VEHLRKIDFAAFAASQERMSTPLVDGDSGVSACSVNCIKTPPGEGSPAGMHVHAVDQVFYIISGTMSLEIAGREYRAEPGTVVAFPAGVPHRNWNAGVEPTIHLAINAPLPDPGVPFATPVAAAGD